MTLRILMVAGMLTMSISACAQSQSTTPAKPGAAPTTRPLPPGQVLDNMLKPAPVAGQVLQPIPDPPKVDTSSGQAAVAPKAAPIQLVREGSIIVDRAGRLTKSADGQNMEFTFDSDGRAMKDPPLLILPNLNLMSMEDAVSGGSQDLRFRVTGMVTEYHGRNYILLDKVTVVPDAGQQL